MMTGIGSPAYLNLQQIPNPEQGVVTPKILFDKVDSQKEDRSIKDYHVKEEFTNFHRLTKKFNQTSWNNIP
jgi:hypothetical protein